MLVLSDEMTNSNRILWKISSNSFKIVLIWSKNVQIILKNGNQAFIDEQFFFFALNGIKTRSLYLTTNE